jgi:hypothetical protein
MSRGRLRRASFLGEKRLQPLEGVDYAPLVPGHAFARLALPPIATLPSSISGDWDALSAFLRHRPRGWGSVPAPLTPAVTVSLWILCGLNLAFGGWLAAVQFGAAACSGTLCAVATLGDHPQFVLILTGLCVLANLTLIPSTRWLSRASGPQIAVVVISLLCGVTALAGVVALMLICALCLAMAFGLFVAVVDRL